MECAIPLPVRGRYQLLSGRSRNWEWELVPSAFSSLQACSHALASLDEMYTLAPFATNPSDIMRPIPLAPPVTKTTLS
jgi:hypothetical protein